MAVSSVTDLAGHVLAGRYRLLAPIGTGASGRVYRADDTKLKRSVAVKVLHPALAEDAGFLRRFRAEAQVAASLSHPHIMTVHDWGDDDVPFMVLELLEGGSLRAMLDEGERLSPAQAARMGRDVASALEYAHSRGIIHRDIKPANLLFDEHGIVRVADFGLARALAEASWTEPAGAMLGTARYASPEQALGSPLDSRSDLYSLALVLVEAVTMRVPFVTDTTVGTLTARTQRPLTVSEDMGPLKAVVERAGRIDPAERYPDAATMSEALADAADALPRPSPLVLPGASDRIDGDPTRAIAVPVTAPLYDQDAAPFDQDAHHEDAHEDGTGSGHRGGRRLVPIFVGIALVAAAIAAAVALSGTGATATAQVPGVVGYDEATATSRAQAAGFELTVADQVTSSDPVGVVISQDPASGEWVGDHDVRVVVSAGPADVAVPDLAAMTQADAIAAIESVGLVPELTTEFSDDVEAGMVIRQNPSSGAEIAPESKVFVVVSDGPAPVVVPPLRESSVDEAIASLTELGLVPSQVEQFDDDVAEGLVVGTDPGPGVEAPKGSEILVVVSLGPELIDVPDVTGETIEDASTELTNLGFDVEVSGSFRPGAKVGSQSPSGGAEVERGSTVTLQLRGGGDDD